ncbi:phospho-glucose isomerase C-terminal SIS domain-containing protein [Jatrophihabitans endophyticus]|uniref:Phospho-glucose isomerase C-terminal SIS domain-containing protein n=1 Tax=Jatrophihabitans endophyticus TaxID=1206085 RepID=A0A1M5TDT3_9ACTN|nr:SIS domain-containing protein [Jatrophihabitans endophyticus]SHH48975.1 phospho-glucose isomerase C-terminal SIS domain-containing protein [Jatrophihabitans endophyticus]
MSPFDEALLDEPAQLRRHDESRLLWALATAGAQVRRAIETVGEFGVDRLAGAGPPRALLIAVDGAPGAARLLGRLSGSRAPALSWDGVELPRWAGATDALLVGSADGRHPRLAELAAQGVQRGLSMAVVAPPGSRVAVAAGRAPVAELPRDLHPRAARWSVLVPLLQALDVLGAASVPQAVLVEIAEALDGQAEACRPDGDAFTNPAKALAAELAQSVPLIAGAGAVAGVAARVVADTLQQLAGSPAVSVTLPDGVGRAGALLRGAGSGSAASADDLFRDRVDEPVALRPRLLVVGDDGAADDPLLGERSDAQIQLDEVAARRAAAALHELAGRLGLRSSRVDVPGGDPVARFAAAVAFGDFTAAYLALGHGLDPGARGPAELAH